MKKFDHIIIGFGKGGKTLAGALAKAGQTVAMVERSSAMYGGTCINVACIPTKYLENQSKAAEAAGGSFPEKQQRYRKAIEGKRKLTSGLRQKNFEKLDLQAGVEVITGAGRFTDSRHVEVTMADGSVELLEGDRIFINTGSRPFIPPIEGIKESRFCYTSDAMMELEQLPKRLLVIGGGYIGLEFASIYANFGSEVTIVQDGPEFLPRDDGEVASEVAGTLEARGIRIVKSARIKSVADGENTVKLTADTPEGVFEAEAEAILVATGRRPNLEGLNVEAAGVELTPQGAVKVDDENRTACPSIYAVGDVIDRIQLTPVAIREGQAFADRMFGGKQTTVEYDNVPNACFSHPPIAGVGLTESQARQKLGSVKVYSSDFRPLKNVLAGRDERSLYKMVCDGVTDRVLGIHMIGPDVAEIIQAAAVAVKAGLTKAQFDATVALHPTMAEELVLLK